jgi:hypothetical protein
MSIGDDARFAKLWHFDCFIVLKAFTTRRLFCKVAQSSACWRQQLKKKRTRRNRRKILVKREKKCTQNWLDKEFRRNLTWKCVKDSDYTRRSFVEYYTEKLSCATWSSIELWSDNKIQHNCSVRSDSSHGHQNTICVCVLICQDIVRYFNHKITAQWKAKTSNPKLNLMCFVCWLYICQITNTASSFFMLLWLCHGQFILHVTVALPRPVRSSCYNGFATAYILLFFVLCCHLSKSVSLSWCVGCCLHTIYFLHVCS